MAESGLLEKLLILAFKSASEAESGGLGNCADHFTALINPETYTLDYKVKTDDKQGHGTSGVQTKFAYMLPDVLSLEFLFDNTGIIDGQPKPEGVFDDVDHFRRILTEFQGSTHEPYHLKLIWGNLIFKGRAVELSITYKLFNADGQPIRAVAKAKFQGSIEERKRVGREDKQSPDVTHRRVVRAGDTLPLLCQEIYGHPMHHLMVAKQNGLTNIRVLTPGVELFFPPLDAGARHP